MELFECFFVNIGQFATGRNNTSEVFLCELQSAIHEVAIHGHQLIVISVLELSPSEVVVFRFWRIGGEHIAEYVLLAGEVNKIFVEPHSPVFRGGNFVVFKIQELVCGHIIGQDIIAVGLQH